MRLANATIHIASRTTEGDEPDVNIREKLVNDVKDKLVRVLHLLAPLDDILGTIARTSCVRARSGVCRVLACTMLTRIDGQAMTKTTCHCRPST